MSIALWHDCRKVLRGKVKYIRRYYACSEEIGREDASTCRHNLTIKCMAASHTYVNEAGQVVPPPIDYRVQYGIPPLQHFIMLLPNDEDPTHEICSLCGSVRTDKIDWQAPSGRVEK